MASILDLVKHVQQQGDIGRERGTQARLGQLYSQAMTAPREGRDALYGQITQIGGIDALKGARAAVGAQDDDINAQLAKHAQMLVSMPPERRAEMYPAFADLGRRAGHPIPPGDWDERYMEGISRIAGINSQKEQYTLSPGAARYGADGRLIAERPFAPPGVQYKSDDDGNLWQVTPDGLKPVPMAGGAPAPTTGGAPGVIGGATSSAMPQDVHSTYRGIVSQFPGTQVTSTTRSPEHNAKVKGHPNSQHLPHRNTAMDVVPPREKWNDVKRAAEARGVQVIDEGDHLHFQQGRQVAQGGPTFGRKGVLTPAQQASQHNAAARLKLAEQAAQRAKEASLRAERDQQLRAQASRSKPLGAEAANKVGLYDNALRAAQGWVKLVVNEDGSFNDIDARLPQAQALLTQAIRAKLRAESGASISEEELKGEVDRYMGGIFSSDGTNTQKARALVQDLIQQRSVLMTGQSNGPAQHPKATAPKPANGGFRILD